MVTFPGEAVGGDPAVQIGDLTGRALATMSIPAGVSVEDWSGEYRQVGVRETHPRALRIINVADGKSRELIDSTADVQRWRGSRTTGGSPRLCSMTELVCW